MLRVFEWLLDGFDEQYTRKFRHSLRRDGYTIDEDTGHIRPSDRGSPQ